MVLAYHLPDQHQVLCPQPHVIWAYGWTTMLGVSMRMSYTAKGRPTLRPCWLPETLGGSH